MKRFLSSILLSVCVVFVLSSCSKEVEKPAVTPSSEASAPQVDNSNSEETQAIALLRGLPTLNTVSSIAIIELDPESENFGDILSEFETPNININAPLHHIYYSPTGRVYATGLDPACSLAEVGLSRDLTGTPQITGLECLDTGGQQVGEDIMWHTVNDTEYMYVTFLGGTGVEQVDAGSVGVFDPQSNALVKTIEARKSLVAEGEPFIMYPHGISAYGDRMVVTSTVHPDLASGVGNSITVIDLNTFTAIQNIVVEDSKPVGYPSSPVEVLFLRPSIVEDVEPAVLVNTMFGFETWKVPFDAASKTFSKPVKLYDGAEQGTGVPLEFYGNETELFISHGIPGSVKRYDLASLPELVTSGPDLVTGAGAHHIIFFPSKTGKQLVAVQNNLLNLGNAKDNDPTDVDFMAKLNAHTVTVHDLADSKRLATIDFKQRYNKGIDNIESLFGSGFTHHH
ncbi:hypothetical protein [uncultured Paraglaciecola sp.]|uniref:hypothetical protein n=1 Tax=uncultured Paraglaciecola sp. TaxID=1765024 RepID=UPI002628191C|nr:hypothetical protein [uncultured Paraglaciecola sp.]